MNRVRAGGHNGLMRRGPSEMEYGMRQLSALLPHVHGRRDGGKIAVCLPWRLALYAGRAAFDACVCGLRRESMRIGSASAIVSSGCLCVFVHCLFSLVMRNFDCRACYIIRTAITKCWSRQSDSRRMICLFKKLRKRFCGYFRTCLVCNYCSNSPKW